LKHFFIPSTVARLRFPDAWLCLFVFIPQFPFCWNQHVPFLKEVHTILSSSGETILSDHNSRPGWIGLRSLIRNPPQVFIPHFEKIVVGICFDEVCVVSMCRLECWPYGPRPGSEGEYVSHYASRPRYGYTGNVWITTYSFLIMVYWLVLTSKRSQANMYTIVCPTELSSMVELRVWFRILFRRCFVVNQESYNKRRFFFFVYPNGLNSEVEADFSPPSLPPCRDRRPVGYHTDIPGSCNTWNWSFRFG